MPTTVTTHIYKVINNLSLTVDISVTPGFSKDGILILHFHGGFMVIGEKGTFPPHWLINACHRRNWAYATASYRLLPEASGTDVLSDTLAATRWIYDNITSRIVLAGSSAGGYLAFATAVSPQAPPIVSVLSIYGMLDLTASRYIQPGQSLRGSVDHLFERLEEINRAMDNKPIDGYPFPGNPATDTRFQWIKAMHEAARIPDVLTRIPGLAARIAAHGVDAIPESHRALFPATFGMTAKLPPVAVIHGDADDLVEFSQSAGIADRLKKSGVDVLFERVQGQGHGFDVKDCLDIDTDEARETGFYSNLARVISFLERKSEIHHT